MKTRKTAGTSIEILLEHLCAPPDHKVSERTPIFISSYGVIGRRLVPDSDPGEGDQMLWRENLQARFVRANMGLWKWHRYFRFTSVRIPFDRAVSEFYWRRDFDQKPLPKEFARRKAFFKKFVIDGAMKMDLGIVHTRGKFCIQDAVRYENLGPDLDRIGAQRGIPIDVSDLPRTKSRTSRQKRELVADHYDADTKQAVRQKPGWVFANLNYSPHPEDCNAVKQAGALQ